MKLTDDILEKKEMIIMVKHLNVAMAPKDSTFQVRINSEIKKTVEEIYARTGMTLTDAFNTFIQQSINVEGLPFLVTQNSKEALREQAIAMLMMDLKRAEERADQEGWIDADDLERELGVLD
ncbi:MAG: type II toxin-antitoxin system RelB/DinJ family antitoxin [Lachnospiraceae bacterium]|nr:type II toxin-antitoxin system RelB/DinJ family antitoxin [Lachnospiraceae bacterium]